MKLRVLPDTNVLISAMIAEDGPPARVLQRGLASAATMVIAEPVWREFEAVARRKFGVGDPVIDDARRFLQHFDWFEPPRSMKVEASTGHGPDDMVLSCAVHAGANVLVTGDRKHLLPLAEYEGVRILSPQALLAELASESD